MSDQLAPNFTLREMARTGHRGLAEDNLLLARSHVVPLRATAVLLQAVRDRYGMPVVVHSGFRSPALNAAISGSKNSQHMRGEAADFHVHGVPLREVWEWIWKDSGLIFGQLILEGWAAGEPSWIHLSLGPPWRAADRSGEVLTFEAGRYTAVDHVPMPR